MAEITLKGNACSTIGELPTVGSDAPDFCVTNNDLADVSLKDYAGKTLVLNIFPSVDTPVCATSVRKFNEEATKADNTVVLCISKDLPFAFKRFCGAEGIENAITASALRDNTFGEAYGATIADGPLAGLLSRAIVVVDEKGKVAYTEQVPEITQEPNYDAALSALK